MTTTPLVTVITVTYNGQRFLAQTLESILRQTFTDFEYLVVDNASTDASREIAAGYAARDPRVRVIASAANLGPSGGLNLGLQEARGKYVANLDHDDLAAPHRLEVQVPLLEADPDLGFVGGWVRVVDETGTLRYAYYPYRIDHADIHWHLMTHCGLAHSTTTMRRSVVMAAGGYSPHHHFICDYELFARLRDRTRFANVPDYLGDYRTFPHQASQRYRRAQHIQMLLLWNSLYLEVTGKQAPLERWQNYYRAGTGAPLTSQTELAAGADQMAAIVEGYLARYTPGPAMAAVIRRDWAIWLLTTAYRHRRLQPTAAADLYARALTIAPDVWQHAETWRTLRAVRRSLQEGPVDVDNHPLPMAGAATAGITPSNPNP